MEVPTDFAPQNEIVLTSTERGPAMADRVPFEGPWCDRHAMWTVNVHMDRIVGLGKSAHAAPSNCM